MASLSLSLAATLVSAPKPFPKKPFYYLFFAFLPNAESSGYGRATGVEAGEGGGDCHCRISERGEGTRKRFFFPLSVALGRLAKAEEEEEEEEERIRIRSKGGNGGKEETREPWNQKQMMPPAAASEAYSVGRKEDEDEEALDGAVTEAAQQPSKGGGVFRLCGRRM